MIFPEMVNLNAAYLKEHIDKVPEKNRSFVKSLLFQYDKSALSSSQVHWLNIWAERVKDGYSGDKPVPTAISAGDFSGVYKLFAKAKASGLKWPKLKLNLPTYMDGEQIGDGKYATKEYGGGELELSVAGQSSKYVGNVMVTDGKTFDSNKWYGTVDLAGKFTPKKNFFEESVVKQDGIVKMLIDLGNKPAEVASLYGKKTGKCMFCALELTDPNSIAWGYGPICADKWGIPHGKHPEAEKYKGIKKIEATITVNAPPEIKGVKPESYPAIKNWHTELLKEMNAKPPVGIVPLVPVVETLKDPVLAPPQKRKREFPF